MNSYNFYVERSVENYNKSDFTFIASVILLTGLGLFTLYFCSQNYAERIFNDSFYFIRRQSISALVGLFGFILFALLKISVIRKVLPIIVGVTFLLCILTFVPGISIEKNGARRWLRMPFAFTLQPSEFVKFTLVVFLANIFDKLETIENPEERSLFPSVLVMIVFTLLVLLQKDLSTSVFIFCVCFMMFAAAGLKIRWVFVVLLMAIPSLFIFITSEQYRIDRIIAFLKPNEGIHTFNYQSIAAKRAISAGGAWGSGIGVGLVQSNRIPEVQADYIFAGWAEAMGLFGVTVYFATLGVFAWRGFKTSVVCKNRFASYASFGFVLMISAQSIVNCAVVCGALPSTGIPLPFFSLGGSSIITTLCMCGFIVNASRINSDNDSTDDYILKSAVSEGDLYE